MSPGTRRRVTSIAIGLVMGAAVLALVIIAGRPVERQPRIPVSDTVDPVSIIAPYQQDAAKADSIFKGSIVNLKGVVRSVDRDSVRGEYFDLGSANTAADWTVQCFVEPGSADALKVGDRVTVRGKGGGSVGTKVIVNDAIWERRE